MLQSDSLIRACRAAVVVLTLISSHVAFTQVSHGRRCLHLDSTSSVRSKMVVRGDTTFTIECWVKSEKQMQSAHIFAFAESDTLLSYGFYMSDGAFGSYGDRVSVSVQYPVTQMLENSVTGNSVRLPVRRWTHLALVRSGSLWLYYCNGEFVGRVVGSTTVSAYQLVLGRNFFGKIADFRIWNVARSQDSIRARMNSSVSASDAGLLINYDMSGCHNNMGWIRLPNHSRLAGTDSLDAYVTGTYSIDSTSADQPPMLPRAAAVTVSSFPHPMQFFARDTRDSARIVIEGSVGTGCDSAMVELERNDTLLRTFRQKLTYQSGIASFHFQPAIHAEISQYSVRLIVKSGSSSWSLREARDLVCGDAFLIAGQSNSHPSDTAMKDVSPYIRTFGIQTSNSNLNPYDDGDTLWGLANGHGFGQYVGGPYLTGVWGYYLQEKLMADEHIPICIVNGGAGASTIEENVPNPADPADLKTVYGRTLYRSIKSGLASKYKAIFWHQGESNTIQGYYNNFKTIYRRWQVDYTAVKRFYVFQVRPSWCGAGTTGALRDLQRTLADSLPNIRVMSTASAPGHNGCHYSKSGYFAIGQSILPWVEHDFYCGKDTINADPPMIYSAAFTTAACDQIKLVFKGLTPHAGLGLHILGDTLAHVGSMMPDYFYLDNTNASILSVTVQRDTVWLKLSGRSNANKITYLPEQFYNGMTLTYEGPTIANIRNIGACTFYHFPIHRSIPPGVASANQQISELRAFPNPFGNHTTVHFHTDSTTCVDIRIMDEFGRPIATLLSGFVEAGDHDIPWQSSQPSVHGFFVRVSTSGENHLLRLVPAAY